jgi:membrane-associated phospholipid phosphatase
VPHLPPSSASRQSFPYLLCAVLLMSTAIFGALAKDVWTQQVFSWDAAIALWLNARATPALDRFWWIVTTLGGVPVMTLMTVALAVALIAQNRASQALFVIISVGGAVVLNLLLKSEFRRARPTLFEPFVVEPNFSFPSGHSTTSAAFVAALVVLSWRTRWRWLASCFGILYAVLVGVSRVYLGAHYPSDVIAAWSVTLAWVAALALVWRSRKKASR